MRITDIDVFIPMVGSRTQCLVRIGTDSGIHGWGESGLSGREHAVAGAIRHFRSFLVGQDPLRRGFLWQRLYRSQYFEGGRVLLAAQSAIDIALHDICGKALGVPVYELLGGRQRDWVPLFATTAASPGPGLIADVEALIAAGWDVVRFVPGTPDDSDPERFEPRASLALTAEWATRLRDAVGPTPTLGIDWHHRLSVAETASFSARMPRGTLDFLEEPIRAQSPDSYEQLRRLIDIPLAIGEEFASKWDFAPYIERGLTEFVRLDIANVGGFSEALKVAGWAETHYLDVMPHHPLGPVCGAATAHLCMAIPNLSWMEFQRSPIADLGFYDERLFPIQPRQDGPRLYVQEMPGLGVEVDMSVLRESEEPWNPPQFHRSDGSIQNW